MVEAGSEDQWCASLGWGPGEASERFKQEVKGHTEKSELSSVALGFSSGRCVGKSLSQVTVSAMPRGRGKSGAGEHGAGSAQGGGRRSGIIPCPLSVLVPSSEVLCLSNVL